MYAYWEIWTFHAPVCLVHILTICYTVVYGIILFYPVDGGSNLLRNVGTNLEISTAGYLRRQDIGTKQEKNLLHYLLVYYKFHMD